MSASDLNLGPSEEEVSAFKRFKPNWLERYLSVGEEMPESEFAGLPLSELNWDTILAKFETAVSFSRKYPTWCADCQVLRWEFEVQAQIAFGIQNLGVFLSFQDQGFEHHLDLLRHHMAKLEKVIQILFDTKRIPRGDSVLGMFTVTIRQKITHERFTQWPPDIQTKADRLLTWSS